MLGSRILTHLAPLSVAFGTAITTPQSSCMQRMYVHHHNETSDMLLFLGIKRSNRARANRNTHVNERAMKKVCGIFQQ